MSGTKKKNIKVPEKLTATNWSRIHEIAKKNEFVTREPHARSTSILHHSGHDRKKKLNRNPIDNSRKSITFDAGAMAVRSTDTSTSKEKKPEHAAYSTSPYWGIKGSDANESRSESARLGGIISLAELFPCFKASMKWSKRMKLWARNKYWRLMVSIFEAVLLIGPQVREFCPKDSDTPFDVMFIITIVVLFVDIVLMCYSVPNYFNFRIDGPWFKQRRASWSSSCTGVGTIEIVGANQNRFRITALEFGGFIFWFDVISALTLLFDITMMNPLLTEQVTIELFPNMDGAILPDFYSYRKWYFLLVVLRTPRIVRLMQASGIIHTWMMTIDKISLFVRNRKLAKMDEVDKVDASKIEGEAEPSQTPPAVEPASLPKYNLKGSAPQVQSSSKKLDNMSRFIQNRDQKSSEPSKARSQHRSNVQSLQSGLNGNAFDYIDTKIYKKARRKTSSQVGKEMHELTVKHVALGCMLTIIVTAVFTNHEKETFMASSMLAMHGTLSSVKGRYGSDTGVLTTVFNMVNLEDDFRFISFKHGNNTLLSKSDNNLRERQKVTYFVKCDDQGKESCDGYEESIGIFDISFFSCQLAAYTLLLVIFIVIFWYVAVSSFAGPIIALVIIPIERMIKILNMLVEDPLGYQRTPKYREFVEERENIEQYSKWKKKNLEGMETSFLMSTILRIGSLMKVGFGDAGAKIIRQSLEIDVDEEMSFMSKQKKNSKTNVSCIFLFCDIRRFTDATECLREEVFVFTNKIAEVVHSLCHSYGGSANKNIGDAFLVSWLLPESDTKPKGGKKKRAGLRTASTKLIAHRGEADKALLAVLKIIIALNYESFFLDDLSAGTRERLKEKFADSSGPLIQMGFGLHAGKAVQGAIGSHRKLDATYISNAVEQAEYLESSTKKYGVKLLMSGEFYGLLTPGNRRRCRQIDQVFFRDDDGDEFEEPPNPHDFEKMELYTYDIDIDNIFENSNSNHSQGKKLSRSVSNVSETESAIDRGSRVSSEVHSLSVTMGLSSSIRTQMIARGATQCVKGRDARGRRFSMSLWKNVNVPREFRVLRECGSEDGGIDSVEGELLLPTERCIYNPSIWLHEDLRFVRGRYSHGQFFQEFNIGLQHYFNGDWDAARECLQAVDAKITDGPARYYLKKIQDTNYVPPRGFTGWSEA